MTPAAAPLIAATAARAIAPRRPLSVSQWADAERFVSTKQSSKPGKWRTDSNPILREPMDALSVRSRVHTVVLKFPIQLGKTEVALNWLGYIFDHAPGPAMAVLPAEKSRNDWIDQKLQPTIDATPAIQRAMVSSASRDSANRRDYKDFTGGMLFLEHAGSPARLKSKSVKYLIVDELDEFVGELRSGDDPLEMLDGRTSAFPNSAKRLYISTPTLASTSRIQPMYEAGDQRRCYVPCPHCGHFQPLEWEGLHWSPDATYAWYACRECGAVIDEHHKPAMLAAHRWVAENPNAPPGYRSYTCNALYYSLGLGPRWADLVQRYRRALGDQAAFKTFRNDRLALVWEDENLKDVRHELISERAEPYALRTAPAHVLACTVGVDTQDDRLEVHIVGWGRGLSATTLDYAVLHGDPAGEDVWVALTDLLNRPIAHALGGLLSVESVAIDGGGHRTEAVKHYVRRALVKRPMVTFGAVAANAEALRKGRTVDVTYGGRTDKRGVVTWQVGTVAIKHLLYSRLAGDAKAEPAARLVRFSDQLPDTFFKGLVSEVWDPRKRRFEKRRGHARNEPLDTWVYAYAATHHPHLRLHRLGPADWDARQARLTVAKQPAPGAPAPATATPPPSAPQAAPVNPLTGRARGSYLDR